MQRIASLVLVLGLVISNLGPANVYAQSVDELRQEFEQKLREAVEKEVAKARGEKIQQEVKSTVKEALEAQPPQAVLGPAAMPPAAGGPPFGLFLHVELLGAGFRGVQTDYAVRNADSTTTIRRVGEFQTVDVVREFAFRPTLGYYLPNGSGILSASIYHAVAAGRDSFRAPGLVVPSVGSPGVIDSLGTLLDSATARNRLQLNQLDVQYQYPIQVTKIFGLTPEVGIRSLWFKNSVKSEYSTDASGFVFSVDQRTNSLEVGPKIGLAGTWEFLRNFSFVARGQGGYLFGNNTAKQVFCWGPILGPDFGPPTSGCGPSNNFRFTDNRGSPFVEGEFSLNYAFGADTILRGLSASLGYRIGTFFGLLNRGKEVGEQNLVQSVFDRLNLTYDTIFFRLHYLW